MCFEHCLCEHLQNGNKITVGSFSGFQTILWIQSFAKSSTHFNLLFSFVLCSLIFVILDTESRAFMHARWALSSLSCISHPHCHLNLHRTNQALSLSRRWRAHIPTKNSTWIVQIHSEAWVWKSLNSRLMVTPKKHSCYLKGNEDIIYSRAKFEWSWLENTDLGHHKFHIQ